MVVVVLKFKLSLLQRIVVIAVEDMDLTHLDKDFKLHLKANKSISVNDKNFWTKLRYKSIFGPKTSV